MGNYKYLITVATITALLACTTTEKKQPEVVAPPQQAEPVFVAEAKTVVLRPEYPSRYRVVDGDTLWDIASRFLQDPWRWPEVWQGNPQVSNPHLIFPGDELVLYYADGKPKIRKTTTPVTPKKLTEDGREIVKLSPQIREMELEKAIKTIPGSMIRPFLKRPLIVSEEAMENAPYIISTEDEHLIAGTGNKIYVQNVTSKTTARYAVVRKGEIYRNRKTEEILGMEALYVATAKLSVFGTTSTMRVENAEREILMGDRLLPIEQEQYNSQFLPHAPKEDISGEILAVVDGADLIGQYHVVVLNLGHRDGIENGHVLAGYNAGRKIRDPRTGDMVQLPDERSGVMMVFRVFEKLSYAIIMEARISMKVSDRVARP